MKNNQNRTNVAESEAINRDKVIVRTSIIGIVANIFLAGFKAVIGLLANSIAVILDAVNNLSDALSSVITIVGTKLASRKPDKKHPFGHGRVEYLSAMVVAAIVLYAGITSLIESVKKIIHPEEAEYTTIGLIIIAVAVAAKFVLGRFVKAQGKKVNSGALIASGSDAFFDSILSLSVLLSALIFLWTGLSLEAYVGVGISVIIIKSGIEMLIETLDDILGKRADKDTVLTIKRLMAEEPEVHGAYDLAIYNYGPDKDYAAVHMEVDDTMTVDRVDELTRRLVEKVYCETGVVLTGISVYSRNTGDNEEAHIRDHVRNLVLAYDWAVQMHGFYVDLAKKTMRFDVVMSFSIDHYEATQILLDMMKKEYPDYTVFITSDIDMSEV